MVALALDRNAGGRTSELTSELVKTCQKLIGMETCMHLTCTGMPKEKVDIALRVSNSWTCCSAFSSSPILLEVGSSISDELL